MLPDNPDQQAQFFYLGLLGIAVLVWTFRSYRHRLGEAMQHAAIWVLIFLAGTLVVSFKDQLTAAVFNDTARQVDTDTVAVERARDGHFYLEAEVNGTPVRFLIDTGASSLVLAADDAARIGLDTAELAYVHPAQTANGVTYSARVRLEEVAVRGFAERGVDAMVSSGGLSKSLLGMTYLNRFRGFRVEGDTFYLSR